MPGDLLDEVSLIDVLRAHRPDEVYNLAAQSFVQTSFGQPVLTGEITALGVTRLLDAIRIVDPDDPLLPGQSAARCSARWSRSRRRRRRRSTPAAPTAWPRSTATGSRSTTARATTCTPIGGILFNHESPRRGLEFVDPQDHPRRGPHQARPRHRAAARQPRGPARLGLRRRLRRGHVADAAAGRARATSSSRPARPTRCASSASWRSATSGSTAQDHVVQDERFFRPAEVDLLVGDADQGPHDARLEAQDVASPSWCG